MYYYIFTSPAPHLKELFLQNKYSENSYSHKGVVSWESKVKGLLDDQDSGVNFLSYYLLVKSAYTAAEITGLFS